MVFWLLEARVFQQMSALLEYPSPIFQQHELLSLPRFGHFPARKWLLENRPSSGTLLQDLEPKNPPKFPKYQKTPRLHELFREVVRASAFFPVTRVRNPTESVQAVLHGVPLMGVQVLRKKRLILLHENRVRRTANKEKSRSPRCRPLKHSMNCSEKKKTPSDIFWGFLL